MPSKTSYTAAAERILDVAEQLVQTRGFNGFSYADIAKKLNVTKASLHYHFPSKEILGRVLIERYEAAFDRELEAIRQQSSLALERLRRYMKLYDAVMREDRICLCGMLAAEYVTLPVAMQNELRRFFKSNERWLAGVLEEGRRTGNLSFKGSAQERAGVLLGALEGMMLVARSYSDGRVFWSTAKRLLADLNKNGAAKSSAADHRR